MSFAKRHRVVLWSTLYSGNPIYNNPIFRQPYSDNTIRQPYIFRQLYISTTAYSEDLLPAYHEKNVKN